MLLKAYLKVITARGKFTMARKSMRPEYKKEEPSVGSRVRLWRIEDTFQHIE
jgi:hypothetical protein